MNESANLFNFKILHSYNFDRDSFRKWEHHFKMQLLHTNLYMHIEYSLQWGESWKLKNQKEKRKEEKIIKIAEEAKKNENVEIVTENFQVLNAMLLIIMFASYLNYA